MTPLRLFLMGLHARWLRRHAQALPSPSPTTLRRLVLMIPWLVFSLGFVALAFFFAGAFLILVTSQDLAISIALTVSGAGFLGMAVGIALALATAALRRFSHRVRPLHPDALLAWSFGAALAWAFGAPALAGIAKAGILSVQVGVAAAALALSVLALGLAGRALRHAPAAVRRIQNEGFARLSAHQKMAVLAKQRRRAPQHR